MIEIVENVSFVNIIQKNKRVNRIVAAQNDLTLKNP